MLTEAQLESARRNYSLFQFAASEARYLIEREWDFNNLEPIYRPLLDIEEVSEEHPTVVSPQVLDSRPSHEILDEAFRKLFPTNLATSELNPANHSILQFALEEAELMLKEAGDKDQINSSAVKPRKSQPENISLRCETEFTDR